jgi:glutamate racemase
MSKGLDHRSRRVESRNFTYVGDNATQKRGSKTHHFVQFIEFAILNTLFAEGVAL